MADATEAELAAARDIVIGALAAAGPARPADGVWKANIAVLIPEIAALMEPTSRMLQRALLCMDAQYIAATYEGFTYEESSTRLVVSLKSDRNDEVETIRTERTDTMAGKAMQAKLERLEKGRRILARKVMEPMHNQPGRSVRILMHFEVLPDRKDAEPRGGRGGPPTARSDPEGRPPPSGSTRSDPEGDSFPTSSGSTSDPGKAYSRNAEQVVRDAIAELPTTQQRNAANKALVVNGIWPVTEDNLDAALTLILLEKT
jgi:hypothetical protein